MYIGRDMSHAYDMYISDSWGGGYLHTADADSLAVLKSLLVLMLQDSFTNHTYLH